MQSRGGLIFTSAANASPEEREGLMYPTRNDTRQGGEGNEAVEALDTHAMGSNAGTGRFRHASAATESSGHPSGASTGDGSTNTRGSLIAQFPTLGRKPSDDSTGGGGSGERSGNGSGGSAWTVGGRDSNSHTPATRASSEISRAPPLQYGRSRKLASVVPDSAGIVAAAQAQLLQAGTAASASGMHSRSKSSGGSAITSSIGLGRPPLPPQEGALHLLPEDAEGGTPATSLSEDTSGERPKHASYPEARAAHSTMEQPQRTVSDTAAAGLGGWLGSFGFLRPYLGGALPIPYTPDRCQASSSTTPQRGPNAASLEAERQHLLLPSAIPINRRDSAYRRATTTAAAYDAADLIDLQRTQTAQQRSKASAVPAVDGIQEDSEDDGEDEGRSLVSHGPSASSGSGEQRGFPAVVVKDTDKRASRTTLGR